MNEKYPNEGNNSLCMVKLINTHYGNKNMGKNLYTKWRGVKRSKTRRSKMSTNDGKIEIFLNDS